MSGDDSGLLYILEMQIEGEKVFKVGVTKRKVYDRVAEIVLSYYHKYRYFPYVRPRRFRKTDDVYAKEAKMHRALKEFRFTSDKQFSGNTELFSGIDEQLLLDIYDRALEDRLEGIIDGRIREITERVEECSGCGEIYRGEVEGVKEQEDVKVES